MRLSAITTAVLLLAACGEKDPVDSNPDDTGSELGPCGTDGDADNDGSCDSVDCDPNDPYTYPGANDIPYDGKDNDCAGDGDLTDVDGDGHDGTLAGGDDCNDGNPTVYPGAEEICYDGIDQDCAGDEDTNDCDGDGYEGRGEDAQDCDDYNADIHPGATEIWYNGVDDDCSGYLDSDYDADGDGDDAEGYEEGTDCDDTDPLTAGGNPELWDGADRNCDGEIDNLDIGDSLAAWFGDRGVYDGFLGMQVAVLDDYDGDGTKSIAVGGYGNVDGGNAGTVYIVDPADGGSFFHDSATTTITGTEAAYFGFDLANVGDLDGDGLDELAAGGPQLNGSGGAVVFLGSSLGAAGEVASTTAHSYLSANALSGFDVTGVGDVNGDGVPDVAVGLGWYDVTHLVVYSGARIAQGGSVSPVSALSQIDGDAQGGLSIGGPDLDGDGQSEVLLGINTLSSGAVVVIDGPMASSEGAVDVSDGVRIRGTGSDAVGITTGWMPDVDGDGVPEVVVRAYGADGDSTAGGVVWVVNGDQLQDGNVNASSVAMYTVNGTVANGHLKSADVAGDHDGDGRPDLVLSHPGDREMAWSLEGETGVRAVTYVHFADQVVAGGTVLASESVVSITSENDDDLMGYGLTIGDVDGNGLDDIVFGVPAASATAGGALVIPSLLGE
ncbi:MAG: VCBS repeat-containing protein [Alphaproteobacteria bacterium]|nr:VCBS repeat-containing protein [Alphaproteobacteria bacterium]